MSFSIRNTTYQAPTAIDLSSLDSSYVKAKETFEEKIPNSVNESVLKFDMVTNSWVWREMNDASISCSRGPSGSLANTHDTQVVSNIIETSIPVETKKVEMSKISKNKQACKRRQQKKKR